MLSARETAAAFGAPMLEDEKPTPTAETRAARMMDSRAAIGPAHPATHAAKDETFDVRVLTW